MDDVLKGVVKGQLVFYEEGNAFNLFISSEDNNSKGQPVVITAVSHESSVLLRPTTSSVDLRVDLNHTPVDRRGLLLFNFQHSTVVNVGGCWKSED